MRKLLGLTVVLAVLGVCAPSYGYILVYKVTGGMKAVEWNSSKIISVSVKGYLALDIDDSNGAVDDADMLLYGKDTNKNPKYYDNYTFGVDVNVGVTWDTASDVVALDIWNFEGPFAYEFTMIGKVKATDVGFGSLDNRIAASSLTGSLDSWRGQLLDNTQDFFGSGTATMTLDTKNTKAANARSTTVYDVIDEFIAELEAKGYSPITL